MGSIYSVWVTVRRQKNGPRGFEGGPNGILSIFRGRVVKPPTKKIYAHKMVHILTINTHPVKVVAKFF